MDVYPYVVNAVITMCHYMLSLINGYDFPHIWTGLFQKAVDSIYLALSLHNYKAVDGFPYVATAFFQKAVDVVFNVLSLHI